MFPQPLKLILLQQRGLAPEGHGLRWNANIDVDDVTKASYRRCFTLFAFSLGSISQLRLVAITLLFPLTLHDIERISATVGTKGIDRNTAFGRSLPSEAQVRTNLITTELLDNFVKVKGQNLLDGTNSRFREAHYYAPCLGGISSVPLLLGSI